MQKEVSILIKRSENENSKAHVACLSRMATSLALKCSVSKPLLDDLEKALKKLNLEAHDSLSSMRENDVPIVSNNTPIDIVNNTISFRVPQVLKGPKSKRAKNIIEKKTRKKKKISQEKGIDYCMHKFFTMSYFIIMCFLICLNHRRRTK
jgi:signal recognition particle subunit SEC65